MRETAHAWEAGEQRAIFADGERRRVAIFDERITRDGERSNLEIHLAYLLETYFVT